MPDRFASESDNRQQTIAFQSNEQRLHAVVQAMPAMLDAFDERGRIIFWNSECERVTGYLADEVIGDEHILEKLYPDEAYRRYVIESTEKQWGHFKNLEFDLTCKDGSVKTIAWSNISNIAPIPGWATWAIGIDVTDRKQAENALIAERDNARNYFDIAGVLLIVIGSDQKVQMINRKGCEILGYQEHEILGRDWFDYFIVGNDRDRVKKVFDQLMTGDYAPVEHYENPVVTKGGRKKLISWHNRVLKDNDGRITGILGSGEDITEKRKWEDLIHNFATSVSSVTGEAFFHSLVEYLSETLEVDYVLVGEWSEQEPEKVQTVAVHAHGQLVDNFEYELEGTPCHNVIAQKPCVYTSDIQKLFPRDQILVDMGVVSYAGLPLFDSNKKPLGILVVLDSKPCDNPELTTAVLSIFAGRVSAELERLKVEAEREGLIKKLAFQNEEMERFVYTVSHDLKTPLVTIKGFAGLLKSDISERNYKNVEDSIERINASADRMHLLLQQLLELSRIGRLQNKPQQVSIAEIANEAIEACEHKQEEQLIEFVVSRDLPMVHGDRVRLLELLQNLINNAAKYTLATGGNGKAKIEVGCRTDSDHQTVCYVKDNGPGIEPQYHDRVFELFYRLEPDSSGTGVGLAIAKRIVEYHRGRIWIESEGKGRGCTFCFVLGNDARHGNSESDVGR